MRRFSKPNTKHLYQLTVRNLQCAHPEVQRTEQILVEANNRDQACRIATANDYEWHDVNMVG